jgi:hypothetical protein
MLLVVYCKSVKIASDEISKVINLIIVCVAINNIIKIIYLPYSNGKYIINIIENNNNDNR